jgi:hypothetical protein
LPLLNGDDVPITHPERITLPYNGSTARINSELGQYRSSSRIAQAVAPSKSTFMWSGPGVPFGMEQGDEWPQGSIDFLALLAHFAPMKFTFF